MKHITTPLAVAAMIALTGCKEKSTPAASEAASPAPAHAEEGSAGASHSQMDAPTAGEAVAHGEAPPGAAAPGDAGRTITVAGLSFTAPEGWQPAPPSNAMRLAELHVPNAGGGESVAVFSVAGGDPNMNITRWVGQFGSDSGEVLKSRETKTINGQTVHLVEMSGTYRGMGMKPPQPNTMMRAAIVEKPGGQHLFIKMTGPVEQMQGLADGWEKLINSMHAP
ncbi:MAG TPA: hypothetical protein ENK11_09245 [Phycisphaerales bacterium]|nr:hypothetical protein [Phycisphaerales bacterium]